VNSDELRRYESELSLAEAEAQAALIRVEALRKIVEGLRALQQPTHQAESLFETAPPVEDNATEVRETEESIGPGASFGFPRGREAVRGVLIDTRRTWKIPELAKEIERRGWMPGVRSKRDAVAATVQRLVKDGEAERVGHGVYRYRLDKLPPLTLVPAAKEERADE
jgi:hypothetical protein